MLTAALAAVVLGEDNINAGDMLRRVMEYYRNLQQALIEMERDSEGGKYPGQYKQELNWSRTKGFDLTVTNAGKDVPKDKHAPNYFRRGDVFWAEFPDGRKARGAAKLTGDKGDSWDMAGDPIFAVIEEQAPSGFSLSPFSDPKAQYAFGKTETWKGEKVREIRMTSPSAGDDVAASFFVSPNGQRLVGVQYRQGKASGWIRYRTQNLTFKQAATMDIDPQ